MTNSVKPDPKLPIVIPRKEAQLVGLLSALSEELTMQLAQALERDRLAGGSGLPYDTILSGLRPKLREQDPAERVPTPQRAFFSVIDGIIVNERGEEKHPGRIARRSLDPIWRWLLKEAGDKINPLIGEITKALLASDRAAIRSSLAPLDAAAGEAIRAAVKKADATPKYLKELTAALGGQRTLEDMRELGRVLQIATHIRTLRDALPPVIDEAIPEEFEIIRSVYDEVEEKFPAGAPYLVLNLSTRVTHPWELFGVAAKLVQAEDDQELKQSDLAMVGEWLVLDLESEAAALKNLKVANFDPRQADEFLRRFAMLQAGMTKEVGMRKEGLWGKRLLKARGAVSEGLEGLFAGILHELRAGLPMQRATSGAKSGALVPVLDRPPDPAVVARLESILVFLATARLFSSQLGYAVAFEKTKTDITTFLEEFGSGVIGLLHSAKRKDRDGIVAWAHACQKVMSAVFTDDAIKIFNRRLAAATAEQQQEKA
jgi:hypothetical protein